MNSKKSFLLIIFLITSLLTFGEILTTHVVARGESFESIAKKYGISQSELKATNPKAKQCFTGLKLNIPKVSPKPKVNTSTKSSSNSSTSSTTSTTKKLSSSTNNTSSKKQSQNSTKKKTNVSDVLDKIGQVADALSNFGQNMANPSLAGTKRTSDGRTYTQKKVDHGGGYFSIVSEYSDGGVMEQSYITCMSCQGSKLCISCNGTGRDRSIPNHFCYLCNGARKCKICSGSPYPGYTSLGSKYKNPYSGVTQYYDTKGNLVDFFDPNNPNTNTQNSNTSSYYSSEPEKKEIREVVCPECKGSRVVLKDNGLCGMFSNQCVSFSCGKCQSYHCKHYSHKTCAECGGTGSINQEKWGGKWIKVYD